MKIDALLAIMAKLRDPVCGCPWDLKQDFASIAPYTIEEAYEVADAIDRRDYADLRDELGDLLLQVVFHSQLATEAGHFTFDDVVESICKKMTDRHPHVFGDDCQDAADSKGWEAAKRREREARGDADTSTLAGISRGLPEWQRATKLQKRAATVGFEWTKAESMLV
ncbi:MAG: nucleoside triphosphate pyrophosphohydrolase, partial [Dokdonella sp.]